MGEKLLTLPREERIIQIFERTGAILEGHFIGTSLNHLDKYVEKRLVYPSTQQTSEICGMFAEDFKDKGIEVVVAPTTGGVILGFETARQLTIMTGKDVANVFIEKTKEGGFKFHEGFSKLVEDKITLILDDVLTTGGSLRGVINEVKKVRGNIGGVGVVWERGDVGPKDIGVDVEIDALCKKKYKSYTEEECAILGPCSKGIPIDPTIGRGEEYLAKNIYKLPRKDS